MTTVDELTRAYGPPPGPEPERPRMSRRKRVALFVAFMLGLPALALAATYLFGTFTGTAVVNSADAAITITNVTGSPVTQGGIACEGSSNQSTAVAQRVDISAVAYRVNVNGQAPGAGVPLGQCTVKITIANGGDAQAQVTAVQEVAVPSGWTFSADPPVTIPGHESKVLTITLSADGSASAVPGGTPFSGKLNVNIPPLGGAV